MPTLLALVSGGAGVPPTPLLPAEAGGCAAARGVHSPAGGECGVPSTAAPPCAASASASASASATHTAGVHGSAADGSGVVPPKS